MELWAGLVDAVQEFVPECGYDGLDGDRVQVGVYDGGLDPTPHGDFLELDDDCETTAVSRILRYRSRSRFRAGTLRSATRRSSRSVLLARMPVLPLSGPIDAGDVCGLDEEPRKTWRTKQGAAHYQ